jgi:hypothetical protein
LWITSDLDHGMQAEPGGDVLTMLVLNRSSLALPLIEQKIEQVLRSPNPSDCFTDKSVDPQKFVSVAAQTIAYAGDAEALRQLGKLIKIDEKRFGGLIDRTLVNARDHRNPFTVAYQGLEMGDPAIDTRVAAWARFQLADKRAPLRNFGPRTTEPVPEGEIQEVRRMWAEAMVGKYGRVPTARDWADDPIASRLDTVHAQALHDHMMGAAAEALERRGKRQ